MLNVDGVVYGNFRCDLSGSDPNRTWISPCKQLNPVIHATRKFIVNLQKNSEVVYFIDLHGHSKLHNFFTYSCKSIVDDLQFRYFPYTLSKLSSYFHLPSCTYGLTPVKNSSARGFVFNLK